MRRKKESIRRVRRKVGRAIGDYDMIREGDRIMVALSGGKDSYCMLDVLVDLQRRAPIEFSLIPVCVDPGFPEFNTGHIADFVAGYGLKLTIKRSNIYENVKRIKNAGDRSCALCSRFRRGILYSLAKEMGCKRIALGHHADDLIETFIMNLFFNGEIKAMAPVWRAEDGFNTVIRPLCYVWEHEVKAYRSAADLVILDFACPLLKGEKYPSRQKIKALISEWSQETTGLKQNLLSSLSNLHPEFLMDKRYLEGLEEEDS